MASELYIKESSDTLKMPDWFRDLVTLGTIVGNWDSSNGRLVVVLACPTSRYAASAISMGIAWAETRKFRSESKEDMFSKLQTLSIGEYISIRANTKQVIGRFLGIENHDQIRIDGSRYLLSRIEEIHIVRSFSRPRSESNKSEVKTQSSMNKFMDPQNHLSTFAQTIIGLVGDKENIREDFEIEIGLRNDKLPREPFEKISEFVKIKDDSRCFGWSCELLSVDELLLTGSPNLDCHLVLANNRACIELAEYAHFKSKVFLLDSRDSLANAQDSIQRYSRYCERIDIAKISWKPHKAFRGIVMVDKNV